MLKHHYGAPYGEIRLKKKTCMLKCHYRALKNCIPIIFFLFKFLVCYNSIVQKSSFTLKLDFEKIEYQKRGISLISLGNEANRWNFCAKRTFAHFPPTFFMFRDIGKSCIIDSCASLEAVNSVSKFVIVLSKTLHVIFNDKVCI